MISICLEQPVINNNKADTNQSAPREVGIFLEQKEVNTLHIFRVLGESGSDLLG